MINERVARPLRKDAARNHALLLEAARAVFAERGLDASLDDIARRAGLGVGTAYRHFANKHEVAEALFVTIIEQFIDDAHHALTIDDPWAALVGFFDSAATVQARDRGLHQVLVGTHMHDETGHVRERLTAPLATLFERAKAAGALREDAEPTDIGAIFMMLAPIYDMSIAGPPELWRRYLALVLDGLRAVERPALPVPPLTESEFDAAMAAAKCMPRSQSALATNPAH